MPTGTGVNTTPVKPVTRLPIKRAISTPTCSGGNNGVIKQLIKILCRDKAVITPVALGKGGGSFVHVATNR